MDLLALLVVHLLAATLIVTVAEMARRFRPAGDGH
jgi:hypothetical protein